jgi:hypothetical protein
MSLFRIKIDVTAFVAYLQLERCSRRKGYQNPTMLWLLAMRRNPLIH